MTRQTSGQAHSLPDGGRDAEWRVGAATRVITPEESMRLAGFSARTDPAEGTHMDLHAKAIAFEDAGGNRAAFVSAEVLAVTRDLRQEVAERVVTECGLDPEALVLNATHTHYGPEYREARFDVYGLSDEERAQGRAYRARLADEVVGVVGEALDALVPADLQYGRARCGIAMNRRLPTPDGIKFAQYPDGPVDLDVQVLAAYRGADTGVDSDGDADLDPGVVLFGYACHPTCLPLISEYSGDWAGHAMANLEERYDATAAFVQGCGGDIKAYPQNEYDLSEQHSRTLSNSVLAALDARTRTVQGPIRTVYDEIEVSFEPGPPRAELEARLDSGDDFARRRAQSLLNRLDEEGSIPTAYPYPIQAIGFGDDLTVVALGGEALVEYSLSLKDRLKGDVWPLAYSNAGFTYVPTERVLREGGYEGGGAVRYTTFPGPPEPNVEERVLGSALALAERVGARRSDQSG